MSAWAESPTSSDPAHADARSELTIVQNEVGHKVESAYKIYSKPQERIMDYMFRKVPPHRNASRHRESNIAYTRTIYINTRTN